MVPFRIAHETAAIGLSNTVLTLRIAYVGRRSRIDFSGAVGTLEFRNFSRTERFWCERLGQCKLMGMEDHDHGI